MTELPKGWAEVRTDQAGDIDLGRQRSPKYHSGPNMKPYLRVANVFEDRIDASDVKSMHFEPNDFERFRLSPGEVLLNEGQSPEFLGRPAIYRGDPPDVAFTNSIIRFRANAAVMPEWALTVFRHHMHSGRFARESRITTNIAHLSAGRLASVEFRVPPLEEQRRIVSAFEEAFSKLDAGETGLRAVRQRLKRMRDAVLAAAVSGRLVRQDPTDAPAAKVLAELGVASTDDAPLWGAIPDGWAETRLGVVASWSSGGTPRAGEAKYYGGGIPWAVIGDLTEGPVLTTAATLTQEGLDNSSAKIVRPGTVLLAMYGASIGRIGVAKVDMATNQAIACAQPREPAISVPYLFWFLKSQRRAFVAQGKGAAQPNISQTILKAWPIALPPPEEQSRIVSEVERQFSFIEACEIAIDTGLARSSALRRSVLKAAFGGKLVPQDPAEEPASLLLERIRAEREAEAVPKATTRRGRVRVVGR